MNDQARKVLDGALRLPMQDRADVAAELLWADEITRRAERAARGESAGRDADAVLDALEQKLRRR